MLINCSGRGYVFVKMLIKWNFFLFCVWYYSNIFNLVYSYVIKKFLLIWLWECIFILKILLVGKFYDFNWKFFSNKMVGYEGNELLNKFCEIIYVGRKENGWVICFYDVMIFYKFNLGRGGRLRL